MPKRKIQTSITDFSETSQSSESHSKKLKITKKSAEVSKTVSLSETKVKKDEAEKNYFNKIQTDYNAIDFQCHKLSASGKSWNFKISSWNVASLKAVVKKKGMEFIRHESPDIMCFQETKCTEKNVAEEAKLKEYHRYFSSGQKSGYAGVALYSKIKPLNVEYGIGDDYEDNEGRAITAEYESFFLVTAYVPNAGRGLITLPKRMEWDLMFTHYLTKLNDKKPVILCGDLNVAHNEIDLKNPAANTRSAGFTQEERDGFTDLLSKGFVDTFRKLYPDKTGAYTFWSYLGNGRSRNVGWRLDYFVVSARLMSSVCDNVIRSEVYGSDHCPITLFLAL